VPRTASRQPARGPLDSIVARAGGVCVARPQHSVAVNYGSAAGELAACVSAVGLADRSDLTKLALRAAPAALDEIVSRFAGATIAPAGALPAAGAWWCAARPGTTIVVAEPERGGRLHDQLRAFAVRLPAVRIEDRSGDWAALALVGRRASPLLRALGVYGDHGDPRRARPLTSHPLAGAPCLWLLESDDQALALVAREQAAVAWTAIERAGRALGICAVGREAVARYGLIRRVRTSI